MRDWQLGIPASELKQIVGVFQDRCPHAQTKLSLPNSPAVAKAIVSRSLVRVGDGFAILRRASRASVHRDFAQRRITVARGDLLVSRMAPPGSLAALRRWLRDLRAAARAEGHGVWVEHFQEDEPVVDQLLALGYRHVATKVSAFSDLKGLYLVGRSPEECCSPPRDSPADLLSLESLGPFLDADELAEVREELSRFSMQWATHYSNYNADQDWTALSLVGYADDPSFIIKPAEMKSSWRRQNERLLTAKPRPTDAAAAFPKTLEVAGRLPGAKDRIRFMRLRGGGSIGRHSDVSDRSAGTRDGAVARLHVPITTHPSVAFECWDHLGRLGRRSFGPGELLYLDHRKPHRVVNGSPADRVHLVIDTESSEALRRILTSGRPAFARPQGRR